MATRNELKELNERVTALSARVEKCMSIVTEIQDGIRKTERQQEYAQVREPDESKMHASLGNTLKLADGSRLESVSIESNSKILFGSGIDIQTLKFADRCTNVVLQGATGVNVRTMESSRNAEPSSVLMRRISLGEGEECIRLSGTDLTFKKMDFRADLVCGPALSRFSRVVFFDCTFRGDVFLSETAYRVAFARCAFETAEMREDTERMIRLNKCVGPNVQK